MRSLFRLTGLLAVALTVTACKSNAPDPNAPVSVQPPAERTGLLIEPADAAVLGYTPHWATDLDVSRNDRITHAIVLEELGLLVTTQSPGNLISAISLRDGQVLWRQAGGERGEEVFEPRAVGTEQVLVNTDKRVFLLNAASGRPEAMSNLTSTVSAAPAMFDDYAVFGGRNGDIFAHDIRAGYSKWTYALKGSIITSPIRSSHGVFAADTLGHYAALIGSTGELLWRNRTWGPVTAQPSTAGDNVYVASRDRSLYSLNRVTGDDNWVFRTTVPLTEAPLPLGRLVFLPIPGQGLQAIQAKDGQPLWVYPDLDAHPITFIDNQILMHTGQSLERLDPDSGQILHAVPTADLLAVRPGPDGSILAISRAGRILRLNPSQ